MKLQQLQEAAYSGEHPLITKIKDAIDKKESSMIEFKLPLKTARDLIAKELGPAEEYPADADTESMLQYMWVTGSTMISLTDQRSPLLMVHVMHTFKN